MVFEFTSSRMWEMSLPGFGVHACKLILFPEAGDICFCIYREIPVLYS